MARDQSQVTVNIYNERVRRSLNGLRSSLDWGRERVRSSRDWMTRASFGGRRQSVADRIRELEEKIRRQDRELRNHRLEFQGQRNGSSRTHPGTLHFDMIANDVDDAKSDVDKENVYNAEVDTDELEQMYEYLDLHECGNARADDGDGTLDLTSRGAHSLVEGTNRVAAKGTLGVPLDSRSITGQDSENSNVAGISTADARQDESNIAASAVRELSGRI